VAMVGIYPLRASSPQIDGIGAVPAP
jgi:hypothetical protein